MRGALRYVRRPVCAALFAAALPAFGQANIERGRKVYEECITCHESKPGEQDMGPSLSGIIGRKVGAQEGFRYSAAMKRSGITWDRQKLGAFLSDPQQLIRGNRMPYSGISDPADLAAILDYIESASR